MMTNPQQQAENFVINETQFHLGFLPTEQSHLKTAGFSQTIQQDTTKGIALLQWVDEDIAVVARRTFTSGEFQQLVNAMEQTLSNSGRIFFTGCGATGRLAILLEAMWRQFWQEFSQNRNLPKPLQGIKNQVHSVMTGGDRALVRSVENFEDYISFGRYQLSEFNPTQNDTVIAISEGGETSSVIGTILEALEVGAQAFFVFNNPAELLSKKVERSRTVIQDPRVTVLDLATGPMAIAGSTRMQATTSELLTIGAALELALGKILRRHNLTDAAVAAESTCEYADMYWQLLEQLATPQARQAIAELADYEAKTYQHQGLITYFSQDHLLDIFTDTTERAPTFMLPPFRKSDDSSSAPSWAFVKHTHLPTAQAWQSVFGREPAGLTWTSQTYKKLSASEKIINSPPKLDNSEIMKYQIGCENDPSRYQNPHCAAAITLFGDEPCLFNNPKSPLRRGFEQQAGHFHRRIAVSLGSIAPSADNIEHIFHADVDIPNSPLKLFQHIAVKLFFNTVSTATMGLMNRVMGNWMVYAETTNKKLIDRSIRLIQHFTNVAYQTACQELFETLGQITATANPAESPKPPTVLTIERLTKKHSHHD